MDQVFVYLGQLEPLHEAQRLAEAHPMTKRKLPIGIQTFLEVREEGCYYVDKTAHTHRLVDRGTHYFLSRPRCFGKSLFVDTLKELFEFKTVGKAPEGVALAQIKENGYADKYRHLGQPIHLVGVEFRREERNVAASTAGDGVTTAANAGRQWERHRGWRYCNSRHTGTLTPGCDRWTIGRCRAGRRASAVAA